jgi:hypothetical protein
MRATFAVERLLNLVEGDRMTWPRQGLPVIWRATCLGGLVGGVTGGLLGTLEWPVVGTFFGAGIGLAIGAPVGLANGLALAAALTATRSRWAARFVAALMSLTCGVVPAYLTHATPHWDWVVPLVMGAVLAGVLGPFAAFGAQPLVLSPRFGARSARDVLTRVMVGAVAGGAGLGTTAGLVIGAATYLPTSPFAAIEGGALGSVSGAVLGVLAATAIATPGLRVRR